MRLGIDVGSTTVKFVVINEDNHICYKRYERHMSDVFNTVAGFMSDLSQTYREELTVGITGSGGMELAKRLNMEFQQEVIACSEAVEKIIPETDVAIELGGEDAKITFYGDSVEQRMNGTCAGGTGAFIDQMAVLLNTDAAGLNEAAKKYRIIYPIAARCGVFAKTDIQPLINEGAAQEDLAASIFQAVVDQTITGLACGRAIKGNVAFLGGPLYFLSELRQRFKETLALKDERIIFPEDGNYFVAIGAAYLAKDISTVENMLMLIKNSAADTVSTDRMHPLFTSEDEYERFRMRHDKTQVERAELTETEGPVFLGIDAGSTTTKLALCDRKGRLLYTDYSSNNGDPVRTCGRMLTNMYSKFPDNVYIGHATTTGYGEKLIQEAMQADYGEVETVAHYTAAKKFLPEVDFILDIGGQDMKCIRIKNKAIESIILNEACSSGCGSFVETYAKSLNMTIEDFVTAAIYAEHPVDLGTRCTVFMNSMVKQAQKEGAKIGDISAGLAYSVVRNSLYKVIKLRNPDDAGRHIVVQGGTFLNDAVLRSLEQVLGREIIRPDISGNMGAYGAALISMNMYSGAEEGMKSRILGPEEIENFSIETKNMNCGGCENQCKLSVCTFNSGNRFITGNRCEKGQRGDFAGGTERNLYNYKSRRIFDYEPLEREQAFRGEIGIPRVLNMYENYPFWFGFFTSLGFRVVLSPASTKKIYELGMDTISSDTACYPAKLVHGHIKWLVSAGVKTIFYPCINHELKENIKGNNHFNCPVVAMYPEVIAGNMDDLFKDRDVNFIHPFIPYANDKRLGKKMTEILTEYNVDSDEIERAIDAGRKAYAEFNDDISKKCSEILNEIEEKNGHGIVLAGRPYHMDPEINHGIDKIIESYGYYVLPESAVAPLGRMPKSIRVWDQWTYHSRLYKAAAFCGSRDDVDLIQLNSFGCGVDAVTTDQVEELLEKHNKLYTLIKIDEGVNTGAIRIRLRSMQAAIRERKANGVSCVPTISPFERVKYTKDMKKNYTVLMPQMAPMHFDLLSEAMRSSGYNVELLSDVDGNAVETGLKYINNDACYPCIVTLGQIISALQSGKYDLDRTAVLMVQTGGGCRASNYIAILRKALEELDMKQVPVISFNGSRKLEQNPGFRFTPRMLIRIMWSMMYGDLFMRLTNAARPYEKTEGSTEALYKKWNEEAKKNIQNLNIRDFKHNTKKIIAEFDELPLKENVKKPKVGIVGEILVKYHPDANNDIVKTIEAEGGEAVVSDILDFFMYCLKNKQFNYRELAGTFIEYLIGSIGIKAAYIYRKNVRKALAASKRFSPSEHIDKLAQKAKKITSLGEQCGEGWYLAGEMVDFVDSGIENIVCLQPFGCLPNHIVGKGMIKPIRKYCSTSNVVAIDFDYGASCVNQLNRIKMMMAVAHRNHKKRVTHSLAEEG